MEAPAEYTGTAIEALFGPTTRFRGFLPDSMTEVEILQDLIALEDILTTGIMWWGLFLFCRNKIVWMTPDVYVSSHMASNADDPVVLELCTKAHPLDPIRVYVRMGTAAAAATATCDFLLRLSATCDKGFVRITGDESPVPPPLSGAGISIFFQESRETLQKLTLRHMVSNEDQWRALATMSRHDVELQMENCSLADGAAAAGAFVECLQRDRGPVKLNFCDIDSQSLANALTGKSRVTRFMPHYEGANDANIAVFFKALANNRGLVDLNLSSQNISDDNWTILCQSLSTHPTLTSLNLLGTAPTQNENDFTFGLPIVLSTRLMADMMHHNIVLHTIARSAEHYDHQMYADMILPCLETNRYRPRVLAITQADIRLRRPLLGRALQTESIRNKPNLLWMFLSDNLDIVVLSNEDDDEEVAEAGSGN
jgi:hypothetical protein